MSSAPRQNAEAKSGGPVFACVQCIAETVATLPLVVPPQRRRGAGRRRSLFSRAEEQVFVAS